MNSKRSAAELFTEVAKRCPYKPESEDYLHWIAGEMQHIETVEAELREINRLKVEEMKRHRAAMAGINARLVEAQKRCRHDLKRGTGECEPTCQKCGWSDEGPPGYDG